MLSFKDLVIHFDPYPIGRCSPAFEASEYRSLSESFPPLDLFEQMDQLGKKYSLSETNHADAYHDFVAGHPSWLAFYRYVKSDAFTGDVVGALAKAGVDLGLDRARIRNRSRFDGAEAVLQRLPRGIAKAIHSTEDRLLRARSGRPVLRARFEFSTLRGDGGHILPHTDAPQKLITLVLSMLGPDGWNADWGGGTEVLRPKDPSASFNRLNRYLAFEETERLHTYPFEPNQCVVFVKTFNSLHGVAPVLGGPEVERRTLTINIERVDTA